jgi:adenine-specific DNA-methyltransferase
MAASQPSPASQRTLGSYYTPSDIAHTLTAWALQDNIGPVLDPSYGICRFLAAAVDVLADASVRRPARLVHGVDIDAEATTESTDALLRRGASSVQFVHKDFFSILPDARFAAVIGNPPYVRHHWQSVEVKAAAASAMEDAGVALSRRASLWAPFLVHADRFVRHDGRLAMLLPGAALQARYASAVWKHLACRYAHLTLVRVGERAFPDALEETVIVLADRRQDRSRRVPLMVEVPTFAALAQSLAEEDSALTLRRRGQRLERSRSTLTTARLLQIAAQHQAATRLGTIARVRIGTVTGANAFFVRAVDDDLLHSVGLDEVAQVVPGSRSMTGVRWTHLDDARVAAAGARCRMLCLSGGDEMSVPMSAAIAAAEKEGIHETSHCSRREPWWAIQPGSLPDAFLAYMAGEAKGIVTNALGARSLNGVHGLAWLVPDASGYLVSTWTSLWALAVEQTARHYAGGVLKLEPGAISALPVILHEDDLALVRLDEVLRQEGLRAARQLADRLVLEETLGFSEHQVRTLQAFVLQMMERRSPSIRALRNADT